MVALYERDATFVAPDGTSASGSEQIRNRFNELLSMAPRVLNAETRIVRAGDIALLFNSWSMELELEADAPMKLAAQSTEVARRQADGSWLYVIDDPASITAAAEP
jgi:ketosteroid isomerase-like protein